ncbi:hypothetical protein [Burkholderia sp. JP2-270]|uniref:P-type ATPase n=1 Tax=Burkholderia sp. JP2-270 TaxID=2217913 RepID=UPI0031B7F760
MPRTEPAGPRVQADSKSRESNQQSALTGEVTGFVVIWVIVLVSVTLDFVQEYRAGQAAEQLKQTVAVRANVIRNGHPQDMPIATLVPGDVVLLAAGDLMLADCRLIEAKDFFVNQALLTGKSYPVVHLACRTPRNETDVFGAVDARCARRAYHGCAAVIEVGS